MSERLRTAGSSAPPYSSRIATNKRCALFRTSSLGTWDKALESRPRYVALASTLEYISEAALLAIKSFAPTECEEVTALDASVGGQYLLQEADNSTSPETVDEDVYGLIAKLFRSAIGEEFEDGMESDFSRALASVLAVYGDQAVEAIAYLVVFEKANPEIAAEALKCLGSLNDPDTHSYRRWLLARSLRATSPTFRDGAIVGLAAMDDPVAIPALQNAAEDEQICELRQDMAMVLRQLEDTASCPSS